MVSLPTTVIEVINALAIDDSLTQRLLFSYRPLDCNVLNSLNKSCFIKIFKLLLSLRNRREQWCHLN